MKTPLPHGCWPSPISAKLISEKSAHLAEPIVQIYKQQQRCFWLESLANEDGRTTIMLHRDGSSRSILPAPFSCRSKVHEYGGGSYCVHANHVYFVSADDQRIYQIDIGAPLNSVKALTAASSMRYADLIFDSTRKQIIAVAEDHKNSHNIINYLVSIPVASSAKITTLVQGDDFYAYPRLDPESKFLCWISWNNPDMPWDSTQLWLSEIDRDGALINKKQLLEGEKPASIFQPHWSPSGDLFFVSDSDNWWNIYRLRRKNLTSPQSEAEAITNLKAEFATPLWVFKMQTFGFLNANTLLACYSENSRWHLTKIFIDQTQKNAVQQIPYDDLYGLSAVENQAIFIAANAKSSPSIVLTDNNGKLKSLTNNKLSIEEKHFSTPQAVTFPTSGNDTAHAFYYPPTHASIESRGAPPMIFICHGGPTGASSTSLNLKIQYWTNRGFAVMDVNFRGSTGYGRAYREKIYRRWGEVDVDDMCAAADYAVEKGWAAQDKLIIKGSSAGGYTTLATLCFRKKFSAGVSLYGVGDLSALINDTHKFEAYYLHKLIGDPDKEQAVYQRRSPINFVENIQCPVLIFQGLQDKVVPPNQATTIVEALNKQGIPVAYVSFANEGHGFRNPTNIKTMLDAELSFYCQIFKLSHPKEVAKLKIKNLT